MKIEGFGKDTTGGKNGEIIWVNNTDEFKNAIELEEPRIIKFSNAGNYELDNPVEIRNGDLTIDGSDNPICIKGRGLRLFADNVIIKNIRVRPGPGWPSDGIEITNSWNVVVDHCSISWSVDELFQATGGGNITVQWCILSEPLRSAGHPKGDHGYGPWTNNNVQGLTMHHNLVVHCQDRIPTVCGGKVDLRNHLVYNPGWTRMNFVSEDAAILMNVINTQYLPGLDSNQAASMTIERRNYDSEIYLKGNRCPSRPADDRPEIACIYDWERKDLSNMLVDVEHNFPNVETHTIEEAYELILNEAGARPRDTADERIVNDVRNGTGRIIDDPSEVGGWPELNMTHDYFEELEPDYTIEVAELVATDVGSIEAAKRFLYLLKLACNGTAMVIRDSEDDAVASVSPEFIELFGYTREEMNELEGEEFFHPDDLFMASIHGNNNLCSYYKARCRKKDTSYVECYVFGSSVKLDGYVWRVLAFEEVV